MAIEAGLEKRLRTKESVEAKRKNLKLFDFGGFSSPKRKKHIAKTPKKHPKVSLSPETQATDST